MSKESENLKKELAKAGSKNDVLSALDSYPSELTDEEVMSIFGGNCANSEELTQEGLPLPTPPTMPPIGF